MSLPRESTCSPGCRDCTSSECRPAFVPLPGQRPAERRTMPSPLRMLADTASSLSTSRSLSAAHCLGADAEFGLLVEPDVFETPAVEDAVDHHSQTLYPRLPAG